MSDATVKRGFGYPMRDWFIDGRAFRTKYDVAQWKALDWSKAWVDMGPSPMGNPGPYWHVPMKDGETVHRLYPRFLKTRWLGLIRKAVIDYHVSEIKRGHTGEDESP